MTSRATRYSFGFVPWLTSVFVDLLVRTWRIEVVEGEEELERMLAESEPVIWCLWHNRIAAGAGLLIRRMVPSGKDFALLSSASRDGALSACVVAAHGVRVVRGSSSRGGARALLDVIRTIRRHGTSPIMVPDGPRGPAYHLKPGTLRIAARTGLPVVCVGFAARRAWVLGSWDRLIVPKPFARVAVTVGEPLPVPDDLAAEEEERVRRQVEERMGELNRRASAAAGVADPFAGRALSRGG